MQKGFTILEGLLILIILAVIGGTGWYIWRGVNQSNKFLASASDTSRKTPVSLDPAHAKHYFAIYQWGVKGYYIGTITPQYAIVERYGHQKAYFSSVQLKAADQACGIDNGAGGYIDRYAAGERLGLKDGSLETIERYVASGKAGAYSHAGKYYYVTSKNTTPCAKAAATKKLQAETYADVQSITKSFITYCSIMVCDSAD